LFLCSSSAYKNDLSLVLRTEISYLLSHQVLFELHFYYASADGIINIMATSHTQGARQGIFGLTTFAASIMD